MDDIPVRASQTSLGMAATHLDTHFTPLYPFGFGLSYTSFTYDNLQLSKKIIKLGESVLISADVTNTGDVSGEEVVQLYIRDLVGSVTRPVKELKGFERIHIQAKQKTTVSFEIHTDDLAFYDRKMQLTTEPGDFIVWIGGCSTTTLCAEFTVT